MNVNLPFPKLRFQFLYTPIWGGGGDQHVTSDAVCLGTARSARCLGPVYGNAAFHRELHLLWPRL